MFGIGFHFCVRLITNSKQLLQNAILKQVNQANATATFALTLVYERAGVPRIQPGSLGGPLLRSGKTCFIMKMVH